MKSTDLDWFVGEHEAIDERLPALAAALRGEGEGVRSLIADLAAELPGHLAREEEVVLPWIVRRLPELEGCVDELVREHVRLLSLVSSLQFLVAAPGPSLQVLGLQFVEAMNRHAESERQLVERAMAVRMPA